MKTSKDPRHLKRRRIVKQLFAESFTHQTQLKKFTNKILKKKKMIDAKIQKAAPIWPVEKLNKIDLAILRLSVYELEYTKTPPKVIIDEAVELAKEFATENSPAFINGVLGAILRKEIIDEKELISS